MPTINKREIARIKSITEIKVVLVKSVNFEALRNINIIEKD